MAGTNPYQTQSAVEKPRQKYRLTFLPMRVTVDVDPDEVPYSGEGREGSILDIAVAHGVDLDHACGGVCACSTCHVIVRSGLESCNPASEEEEDMLDSAPGLELSSRLGCQTVPNGTADVVVEIPDWNRNHAREVHE